MTSTQSFTLSESDRELLPSAEEVREYSERGHHLSRKLFTDQEIETLVLESERFYAGHRDRELPVRPPNLAYWTPEQGNVQRHNDYVHYESDAIAAILRKPLLGAVAAMLAQTHEVRVFQSTLIYKPPRPDEPTNHVPWHMDRHYWQTCSSENMLTAFIPFHDCGEEMGTITMVDGSNRWEEIPGDDSTRHFAQRDRSELEVLLKENASHNSAEVVKVPMIIPQGHVSFHHCRTYHGSGQNLSDRPRRAISLHLQDGDNRYRPYHKPSGERVVYNHDVVVATDADGHPDYSDQTFCPTLWRN